MRKLLYARQFKKLKMDCKAHGIQIEAIWGDSDVELKCGKHRLVYSFTPFCKDPFRRALAQWFDGRADPYTLPLNCADIAIVLSLPAEAVYTPRSLRYYGKQYTSLISFLPSETQEIIRRIHLGISGIEKRLSEMTYGNNYIYLRPIRGGGVSSRIAFPDSCCTHEICRGFALKTVPEATEQFLKDNGYLADYIPPMEGRLMYPDPEIFLWENEQEPIAPDILKHALRSLPGSIQFHHASPTPSCSKLDENDQESDVVVDAIKTSCDSVTPRIDEMRNRAFRRSSGILAQASTPRTDNKLRRFGTWEALDKLFLRQNRRTSQPLPADIASLDRFKSERQKAGEGMEGYILPTIHLDEYLTPRPVTIQDYNRKKSQNKIPKWDEERTSCSRKELQW